MNPARVHCLWSRGQQNDISPLMNL